METNIHFLGREMFQTKLAEKIKTQFYSQYQVRKISPPPEFDPQTVQPVASRYTD